MNQGKSINIFYHNSNKGKSYNHIEGKGKGKNYYIAESYNDVQSKGKSYNNIKGKSKGKLEDKLDNIGNKQSNSSSTYIKGNYKGKCNYVSIYNIKRHEFYIEEQTIKAVAHVLSSILRHSHKYGNYCVDLNDFYFFNDSIQPWMPLDYLYEYFIIPVILKSTIHPTVQDIIHNLSNCSYHTFKKYINMLLSRSDC